MKWMALVLLCLGAALASASPAAAQESGNRAYQHYRLQHANPYAYGMPKNHFRWGWFGATPRWDVTHEPCNWGLSQIHHVHHMHYLDMYQATHRYSQ